MEAHLQFGKLERITWKLTTKDIVDLIIDAVKRDANCPKEVRDSRWNSHLFDVEVFENSDGQMVAEIVLQTEHIQTQTRDVIA